MPDQRADAAPSDPSPSSTPSGPTFAQLGLDPRLVAATDALGFSHPTGIQAQAIPPLLEGRDVIARARTGSGKTAAFGLPLLHHIADVGSPGPRALVLAPTRELAMQVADALDSFAKNLKLRSVTLYGGAPYGPQVSALRAGVPIVVGTPGRIIDHFDRGTLDLSGIEMVVLDEADEMLRMGFIEDVEKLLGATPPQRRVALFSATMPGPIRRVASQYLSDPLMVESDMERGTTVDHVRQRVVTVPQRFKAGALIRYLRGEERGATLVFSRTRAGCGAVAETLDEAGFEVDVLNGDLAQAERERVLTRLRGGRVGVVVATDVAARGLDVDHITHVVNLEPPDNAEAYTHRIGRTGRAGREGTALTLLSPQEVGKFRRQTQSLGAQIEDYTLPTDAAIAQRARAGLAKELAEAGDGGRGWLEHLVEEGADLMELAAAALELLARERGIPLRRDLPDELPDWARPRQQSAPRPFAPRAGSSPAGPPRGPRGGSMGDADRAPDEVQLFIGGGRDNGIRAGDLVGALAGETGLSGQDIGRIQVSDRASFVGVTRAVAEQVLSGRNTINIRGRDLKLDLARPLGGPAAPPWKQPGGHGKRPPMPNKGRRDNAPAGRFSKGPGPKR